MAHGFATSLLLLYSLLHFVILIKCAQLPPQCIPSEKEALTKFKTKLVDPFHHLKSWDDGSNCCQWAGITCDNTTGNVIKLDIHSPCKYSELESFGPQIPCWNLSGQVDPVLAQLKHLRYIDFSQNAFGGLPIPTFLSGMKELHHLNLSTAGFGGSVPKQLGNLSNLQVLDISSDCYGTNLQSTDLNWLRTMPALKHLEMNHVNLSTLSPDWIHVFNKLPNLEIFGASSCDIQNIDPKPLFYNFTSLRVLDLSHNYNLHGVSLLQRMTNLSAIEFLDLSGSSNGIENNLYTLSELPNLHELILSDCNLHVNVSKLFYGSWRKIRRLKLDNNDIYGELPDSMGNITSLEELGMEVTNITGCLSDKFIRNLKYVALGSNGITSIQVGNSTSLEYLYLSGNSVIFLQGDYFRNLKNLKHLDFSGNRLTSIQKELGLLTGLEYLDLSNNNITGGIPPEIGNLSSLKTMDFSDNMIHGVIPKELGRMASLNSLDLSANNLYGSVPREIWNLSSLKTMGFSDNMIHGVIPNELGRLASLNILDLSANNLNGSVPREIGNLVKLTEMSLNNNELAGGLPKDIGKLINLQTMDVGSNKLNGTLPSTMGQLSSLESLDLSSNFFDGPISEAHFQNMTKLQHLYLSSNFLRFQFPPNWVPSFQLTQADLRSCHIGPSFPTWLRTQNNIQMLDMSNTSIDDKIPLWFWNVTKHSVHLNLSDNKIGGHLPNPFAPFIPFKTNLYIDLSNNLISGKIPRLSFSLDLLDLSDNLLTGPIPEDICNKSVGCASIFLAARNKINGSIPSAFGENEDISLIDLSSNSLSGKIPFNLGKIRDLEVLDLSRNQLSGKLQWSLVILNSLKSLNLEKNMLTGMLPSSLGNCTSIEVLDVGENKFHGNIPGWIGNKFPALRILRLRNNSFTGQIPSSLTTLQFLHVLDLAANSLSGKIPNTLGGLISLKQVKKASEDLIYGFYYHERVNVSMKGQMLEYYSRTLPLVASIDLSFNNLSGHIPSELADLYGLLALDLSHNKLSGSILNNIGQLRQLQSLDLSWNELSGEIPQSISNLTFLSQLNLSHNELSGRIPSGQQLQTLDDPSIYVGNSQICGHPLPNKCPGDDLQKSPIQPINKITKEEDNSRIWFYVSLGTGFVSGFWVFYGVLIFKNSFRSAYFRGFDSMAVWLLVGLTLMKARIERKLQRG